MPLGDYGLNCTVAPSNGEHQEILSLEYAVCKISVESAVLVGKESSWLFFEFISIYRPCCTQLRVVSSNLC